MCMNWHQGPNDESFVCVWMCTTCRNIPQILSSINAQLKDIATLQQTNAELVADLSTLTLEVVKLRT